MLKKLRFLENRNELIKVRNVHTTKKCTIDSYGTFIEQAKENITSIFSIEEHYQKFISLGKELYELNKDKIEKLEYKDGAISFLVAKLIINKMNLESKEVTKKWVENNPIYLIDIDQKHDKIETDVLIDLAIFSYLVNSSLNNYYNGDYSNEISFETFTNLKKDKLENFYELISMIMKTYEINAKFREQTEISYNTVSHKVEFARVYESIYSLYWFILKMQILCFSNGYKFINLCSCGNVIIGKATLCSPCNLAKDARRNREKRENKKKVSLN